MTRAPDPDDDAKPASEPGDALVLGRLPPGRAAPLNGASSAAAHAHAEHAEHAARAARAQAAAASRLRGPSAPRRAGAPSPAELSGAYAGLVTRAIAYVIDAAALNFVALVVGVAAALAVSVFRLSDTLETVVAATLGALYFVWAFGYFVVFWSSTGQTPGSRVMRIRVIDAAGGPSISPRRAFTRVVGLVLATIPLFAGFFMMLWDRRRRCLQDHLARTVVVHAAPQVRAHPAPDATIIRTG